MKLLPLANEAFAKVDDEDYDRLISMGSWCRVNGYPALNQKDINGCPIFLHQVVGPEQVDPTTVYHHKNEDILDAQKHNIVLVSKGVNTILGRKKTNNKSGHTGVRWHHGAQKWVVEHRRKYLGLFSSFESAVQVYEEAKTKFLQESGYE